MKHAGGTIVTADGTSLRLEQWEPDAPVRFVVMIVHGGGDHIGRFGAVVDTFMAAGAFVFGIDLRGQGRSGGTPGHVERFEDYAADLRHVLLDVAASRPEAERPDRLPWFLYAHSTGALASLLYLLDYAGDIPLRGVVLSAPLLGLAMPVPAYKRMAARVAVKLWPTFSLPSGIPADYISRDPTAVAAYVADLRRVRLSSAKWFYAMQRAIARVNAEISRIRTPLLWLVATGDRITDPTANRPVFSRLEDPERDDQSLVELEGYYHEAHNELPEPRARAMKLVRAWVEARASR